MSHLNILPEGKREIANEESLKTLDTFINNNLDIINRVYAGEIVATDNKDFPRFKQFVDLVNQVSKDSGVSYSDLINSIKTYSGVTPKKTTSNKSPVKNVTTEEDQKLKDQEAIKPAKKYDFKVGDQEGVIKDGDTVHIGDYKLRLAGVDSPESDQQPIASEILKWSREWFKRNPDFSVTYLTEDKYGRQVSVIKSNTTGEVYNLELIKNGYAFFNTKYPDVGDPALQAQMKAADLVNMQAWAANPTDETKLYYYTRPDLWRQNNPDTSSHNSDVMRQNAKVNGKEVEKTAADTQVGWLEDPVISSESPYKFMEQQATIGHLSRLYDSYYSSADVKIWITNEAGNKVMVDLITGIGYNYNVNSMPVYTIGSRFPVFFTRGNSIGNGTLVIPFKNTYYLKNILQYVLDEYTPTAEERKASRAEDKQLEEMTDEELESYEAQQYRGVDVVDVGSIVSYFDIEIRFDNSNAYHRDTFKSSIILKDCKLTGDTTEIASTRDGAIQQGYTFLFRNVISGEN